MLGALIVLAVIFFSALAPSRFLSLETPRAMAFQMPELGILALAMMIPLMSGGAEPGDHCDRQSFRPGDGLRESGEF